MPEEGDEGEEQGEEEDEGDADEEKMNPGALGSARAEGALARRPSAAGSRVSSRARIRGWNILFLFRRRGLARLHRALMTESSL